MQKNNEITKTTKCRKTEKYILMSQHSLTLIEEMCVEYVCLRAQCNIVYTSRFARKCFISVLNPYIECFKSCSCINTQQIIHHHLHGANLFNTKLLFESIFHRSIERFMLLQCNRQQFSICAFQI